MNNSYYHTPNDVIISPQYIYEIQDTKNIVELQQKKIQAELSKEHTAMNLYSVRIMTVEAGIITIKSMIMPVCGGFGK